MLIIFSFGFTPSGRAKKKIKSNIFMCFNIRVKEVRGNIFVSFGPECFRKDRIKYIYIYNLIVWDVCF